jgi:hypothetical protein
MGFAFTVLKKGWGRYVDKWWVWALIGAGLVFIFNNSGGNQNLNDCISASRLGNNVSYRNVCDFAVTAHYCEEQVGTNLLGRRPSCQIKRVAPNQSMALIYSPEGGGNNLLQSAVTGYISRIAVCDASTRPVFTETNRYECR